MHLLLPAKIDLFDNLICRCLRASRSIALLHCLGLRLGFCSIFSVTRPLSLHRIALLHGKAIVTTIGIRVCKTVLKVPALDVFNVPINNKKFIIIFYVKKAAKYLLDEKRSKCLVVKVSDLGLELGAASILSPIIIIFL